MNFLRNSLLLLISLFFSLSASAQILNDSAQNVYGPKTTRYFLEEDIFNSIDTLYYIDTVLNGFHRYTYPQKNNYKYLDLGNKGTAIQPLFYKAPSNIGFRSGFDVYNLYYEDLVDMKFYDTKSPYSKFYYVQGGKGISFLETELSRNVTPNWNLGIAFNRLGANSQIEFEPRPNNPEVDHFSYSAYTAFKTDDGRYYVDAYFRRMHHQVREPGGVNLTSDYADTVSGVFNAAEFFESYDSHNKELANATSGDLRVNMHLYHQYKFSNLLGVYHLFDFESQRARYEDASQTEYRPAFYGVNLIDITATPKETTYFKIFRNDIGLKGEINQFKYRFYYRRRNFFIDNQRLEDVDWQSEDITGGEFAVRFSERSVLHINAEFLGNSTFNKQKKKDYKGDFLFKNRFLNVKYNIGQYNPSYLQQTYFSNHHSWSNEEFKPIFSSDLSVSSSATLGPFTIAPNVKFSTIDDYIYFKRINKQVQPVQDTSTITVISPGVDLNIKLGRFNLKNNFTYNQVNSNGKDIIRLPKQMYNFLLYYQQVVTRKSHVLQAGFDGHWQTGFAADRYMPSIQQFYVQDANGKFPEKYIVNSYFVIDVFAAMKINRTRVFAKYSNITRAVNGGYLVRPFYYGFRSVLDVGVNWMFFD